MKLLVITQAVDLDDPALGFFHRWLELFSDKVQLTVICLRLGRHNLPKSVKILSLGKNEGRARPTYLFRFFKYIFQFRKNYDAVLVHMNPEYVVLGGLFWRLGNKKIVLWYVHKKVDWKLRLAEKLADIIFTASLESFRLLSPKVVILGHGIDTNHFRPASPFPAGPLRILAVGRISLTKDLMTPIRAVEELLQHRSDVLLDIAGALVWPEDEKYLEKLKNYIQENQLEGKINFLGGIAYEKMPQVYQSHHLLIHSSQTGRVDKVVLEALACGLQVFTSSEAYGDLKNLVGRFQPADWRDLAEKIKKIPGPVKPNLAAAAYVKEKSSLPALIDKLVSAILTLW